MEASQSLWGDVEHKSIQGSAVVTPLSFEQEPDINSGRRYHLLTRPKPIISISGKKHHFHNEFMFVISVYKQHQKICQHARTFLMTTFVLLAGLWNTIWCRQYRRFNLWYCCHQIMRRASLQHHYTSASGLHSWGGKLKFIFCTFLVFAHFGLFLFFLQFLVFARVWMLVCNVLPSWRHTHLSICISSIFFAKLGAFAMIGWESFEENKQIRSFQLVYFLESLRWWISFTKPSTLSFVLKIPI